MAEAAQKEEDRVNKAVAEKVEAKVNVRIDAALPRIQAAADAKAEAKVCDELANLRFIAEEQDRELAELKNNQKKRLAEAKCSGIEEMRRLMKES